MSGTYPPHGYGGRRRAHPEDPGHGEDRWYDSGHGYGDTGEPDYRGARWDHDPSVTAGYHGEPAPAHGYPPRQADPYRGDSYGREPYGGPYEGYPGYSQPDRWGDRDPGYGWGDAEESAAAPGYPGWSGQADRAGRSRASEARAARPRRRGARAGVAVTLALAVLALAAVGGWLYGRPILAQWPATLAKPEHLAGLQLSTEPALQQAADEIAADIRKDVKVDEAVAGFYHDPAAPEKLVALVGGTAFLASPKAELEEAFSSARGEGMTVGEVVPVNAGPLGGLARCAPAEQAAEGDTKVPLSVCAWADHGSLLIGLFFHRSINESAALLRTIRGEMLKR